MRNKRSLQTPSTEEEAFDFIATTENNGAADNTDDGDEHDHDEDEDGMDQEDSE
jgi:hypothetical protein